MFYYAEIKSKSKTKARQKQDKSKSAGSVYGAFVDERITGGAFGKKHYR
ncbi:hypothetical protein [Aneurinibacillus terranovensis]